MSGERAGKEKRAGPSVKQGKSRVEKDREKIEQFGSEGERNGKKERQFKNEKEVECER